MWAGHEEYRDILLLHLSRELAVDEYINGPCKKVPASSAEDPRIATPLSHFSALKICTLLNIVPGT